MALTELLGFLTGAINVWLLAKQNIWNWPVGLANNALYVAVFLNSGLYGDAGLQLVYITLGIYGWWLWGQRRKVANDDGGGLPVTRTPRDAWMWMAPATAFSAIALYFFLARFTDSTVPGWDAITTALSLAATYGQARKYLESWWIWILADIIYIPLYAYKNLNLTAALYFIFMILCVMGLRSWSQSVRHPAGDPRANRASGLGE
ncbi:MAG: nicotinamide riboside transporter PnuC [Bryobacteraceae bacterium]